MHSSLLATEIGPWDGSVTQAEPIGIPPWDLSNWVYENKLPLRRGSWEESDDAGNLDYNLMEKIWENETDI